MVSCTVDFDLPGKQCGQVEIPQSTNSSGWSSLVVPIACISSGREGPTVLVLGGNHGDEYEGQIVAAQLVKELEAEDVAGRIIVIPCLSMPASAAATRLWPSGANFNRSFPGDASGTAPEQLAYFLSSELFAMADVVVDIHSGGRGMYAFPISHMHWVEDEKQRSRMLAAMKAWNTDYHLIYIDVAGDGLLPSEAERQGKIVVTTELGGAGYATAETLRIGREGLMNVLRHFDVLPGGAVTRHDLGKDEAVLLDGRDPAYYLRASASGVYENMKNAGDWVDAGEAVGRIHFLDRIADEAAVVTAATAGILIFVRGLPIVTPGDCVAVVAPVFSQ